MFRSPYRHHVGSFDFGNRNYFVVDTLAGLSYIKGEFKFIIYLLWIKFYKIVFTDFDLILESQAVQRIPQLPILAETGRYPSNQSLHIQRNKSGQFSQFRRETKTSGNRTIRLQVSSASVRPFLAVAELQNLQKYWT